MAASRRELLHAIDHNNVKTVEKVLQAHGDDVRESCSRFGAVPAMFARFGYRAASWLHTPLQYACVHDDTGDIVETLIRAGCNVNNVGSLLVSPLHLACKFNHERSVHILLASGADLSLTDGAGRTPLDLAKSAGVRKLLEDAALRNELKPEWVMVDLSAPSPNHHHHPNTHAQSPPPYTPTAITAPCTPTSPYANPPAGGVSVAPSPTCVTPTRPARSSSALSPGCESPSSQPVPISHPHACTCLHCHSARDAEEPSQTPTPGTSMSSSRHHESGGATPSTWKTFSGRQTGPDGYRRGDFSRGLFRMLRSRSECCSVVPPEADDITTFGLIPFEELDVKEKVGSGSFGTVYSAHWKGTRLAAKVLKRSTSAFRSQQRTPTGDESDEDDVLARMQASLTCKQASESEGNARSKGDLLNEIRVFSLLSEVQHKNIIAFIGACSVGDHICLCTEFATDGSLYDFMHTRVNVGYNLHTVLRWALEIADGMQYLESKGIVHRDLKSPNILLTREGFSTLKDKQREEEEGAEIASLICKLCDFGLARESTRLEGDKACGTFRWMAPEVMKNELVTSKSDVYSYGIVLWEIATREKPFGDVSVFEVVYSVCEYGTRPPIPEGFPVPLHELLTLCWDADPQGRPNFHQILETLRHAPLTFPKTEPAASRSEVSSEPVVRSSPSKGEDVKKDALRSVRALGVSQSDWSREIQASWECIPRPDVGRVEGLCVECARQEVCKTLSPSFPLLSLYLAAVAARNAEKSSVEEYADSPVKSCRNCGKSVVEDTKELSNVS